jgi:subtilisin family serine protease
MTRKMTTIVVSIAFLVLVVLFDREAFGQVGFDPDPYPPNDPLYLPSAEYPFGQLWIQTTRVDRAWRLVGYQHGYTVQHGDPNSTIAIIDMGIQTDHPEFIGKLHAESHSVLIDGPSSNSFQYCDCDTSRPAFAYEVIDDLPGFGHGTKTAGLAAALGDNNEGLGGHLLGLSADGSTSVCTGCHSRL